MPALVKDAGFSRLSPGLFAWSIASFFYLYQYALRSAPAAVVPQLSQALGVTAAGLSTLTGLFYYGYAFFSLIAGFAMDRFGPRKVMPIASAAIGGGAFLFATGNPALAAVGSFLQGAAAIFGFVAAVYIATTRFSAAQAATLIGLTQMLGMAGSVVGMFVVGPAIAAGLPWNAFWLFMGFLGIALAGAHMAFIPKEQHFDKTAGSDSRGGRIRNMTAGFRSVFSNPQSILCGVIAGLLFIPTTIFGMTWGVLFLQEGHGLPYTMAVLRSASVSVGWMIGAPLLGMLSDRIGRRKPVIIGSAVVLFGCLLAILFGSPGLFPAYSLGLVAGIASGAAMLPYTVIKEANRPEYGGTATGVICISELLSVRASRSSLRHAARPREPRRHAGTDSLSNRLYAPSPGRRPCDGRDILFARNGTRIHLINAAPRRAATHAWVSRNQPIGARPERDHNA